MSDTTNAGLWRRLRGDHLRDVGEDPDPRFTFANERTFLAWNRTSLALIVAGLAVAQFLEFGVPGLRLVIAIPLLGLGALTAIVSYERWEASERAIRLQQPMTYSSLPRIVAYGVGAVALVAAILAVVDLAS